MPADLPSAVAERIDTYPGLADALGHTADAPRRFKDVAASPDVPLPILVFVNVAGRTDFDSRLAGVESSYWDFHVYADDDQDAHDICELVLAAFKGWTEEPDDGRIVTSLPTYHRETADTRDGPGGVYPVFHHVRTFRFNQVRRA